MNRGFYRGKRIDTGDWIYGFYAKSGDKAYIIKDNDIAIGYMTMKEVAPETVGQYTGLKDRKGTDIFEGDIVNIIRADRNGKVEWRENDAAFEVVGDCLEASFLENLWGYDVEVIGNIYENPELLKGEGE